MPIPFLVAELRVHQQRHEQHAEHDQWRPAPEGERQRLKGDEHDGQGVVAPEALRSGLLAGELDERQCQGEDRDGRVPPRRWDAAQRGDQFR